MAFKQHKYLFLSLLLIISLNTQLSASDTNCINGDRVEQGIEISIGGTCVEPPTYPYPENYDCGSDMRLVQGTANTCIDGTETTDIEPFLPRKECLPGKALDQVTQECSIDILNSAPTSNAGEDKNVEVNTAVTITGSGTDSDGTIDFYVWKKGNTVLASAASFAYTPTIIGTDMLTLTVTDNDGASASDSMNVVVEAAPPVNQAPVADAGNNQSVLVSETVTLDGSESSDPNSDVITYSWSFTERPNGSSASLSSTAIKPTFTADVAGTYILSLVVNDGTLNSSSDSVIVTATTFPGIPLTFENNTSYFISDCYSNDCPGIATSEINVVGAATSISKVTIKLDVSHGNISDFLVKLISPSGTSIVLTDPDLEYAFFGEYLQYCDTIFDDAAGVSIMDALGQPACITGTYRPEVALGIFIGEDAVGTWSLQVEDWVWVDEGTLNSWSITIISSDTATPQEVAIEKIKVYADNQSNPVPIIQDYINADVTGVTEENIDDVNSVIASLMGSEVDTTIKIQAAVDSVVNDTVSFMSDVMPIFVDYCISCHSTTSNNRTFKVGDAAYTYNNITTNSLINTMSPDLSIILTKGNAEVSHNGGDNFSDISSQIVRDWIEQGGWEN